MFNKLLDTFIVNVFNIPYKYPYKTLRLFRDLVLIQILDHVSEISLVCFSSIDEDHMQLLLVLS